MLRSVKHDYHKIMQDYMLKLAENLQIRIILLTKMNFCGIILANEQWRSFSHTPELSGVWESAPFIFL